MAFEGINAVQLKQSLLECKRDIKHSTTTEYCTNNSILNSNIWITKSKSKLSDALKTLNGVYADLENLIDKYVEVAGMIENYKTLENSNASLEQKNKDLETQRYYDEWHSEEYVDENGETQTRSWCETKENYDVTNQINTNNSQMAENKSQMASLQNSVFNSL